MKQSTEIIITIITTFILLFATSFLLDLKIIEISYTRTILVFMLMITEAVIGFLLLKNVVKR